MSKTTSSKTNATLWTLQVLLAALFIFAGGFKLVAPIAEMTKQMPVALPGAFLRLIGVLEVVGGLGLILPGVLRLRASLTPLAAGGLVIIMSGAIGTTITTGPFKMATIPFVVGVLAATVAYGRARVVPVQRTARAEHRSADGRPVARSVA